MATYGWIALELLIGFGVLFTMTKLLGKTHLSQLTPFDFISALLMGELLGNAVYDQEVHIWQILFAAVIWGGLIYSTAWITQKVTKTRKFLEGEPSILIRNGVLQYHAFKANSIDINELQSLVRQKGFFSLQEVAYAILETNGTVSVIPHSDHDIPRRSEWNLPEVPPRLPLTLILDGQVLTENLKKANLSKQWLRKELAKQNISNFSEVFYAEWLEGGKLYVSKYDERQTASKA